MNSELMPAKQNKTKVLHVHVYVFPVTHLNYNDSGISLLLLTSVWVLLSP